MTKQKNTKRALLASVLSMMLCMAMLVGSTFAWFTDSVTSGKNKIVAGNLDVELEYATKFDDDGNPTEWTTVGEMTNLFKATEGENATLWEPGHTEYAVLRVRNAGSLALKYNFALNVYGDESGSEEKTYTSVKGNEFILSDYLVFNNVAGAAKPANRESLWVADVAAEEAMMGTKAFAAFEKTDAKLLPKGEDVFTLAVYMPTWVGNEANYRGEEAPTIFLGLTLKAIQVDEESDSFGSDYDKGAKFPTEVDTNEDMQTLLSEDGAYLKLSDEYTDAGVFNLTSKTKSITNATLDGNGHTVAGITVDPATAVNGLVVENFKLDGAGLDLLAWSFQAGFKNVTIRNCEITNTENSGINFNVAAGVVENITIENCIIDTTSNTTSSGILANNSSGDFTVRGCIIKNTAHSGIQISNHIGDSGKITIEGNTIVNWNSDNDNTNGGYGINAVYKTGNERFIAVNNNTFDKQFIAGAEDNGKIVRMRYSTLGLKDVDIKYPNTLEDLTNQYYEAIDNDYSRVLAAQ